MANPTFAEFDAVDFLARHPTIANAGANQFANSQPNFGGKVIDHPEAAQIAYNYFIASGGESSGLAWQKKAAATTTTTFTPFTQAEAESAVKERYQFYLKRAHDAAGLVSWSAALINNSKVMDKASALAELNEAFTESGEYKALLAAGDANTGEPGGGFMDAIANLPGWVKIGGGIAAVVAVSMFSGGNKR